MIDVASVQAHQCNAEALIQVRAEPMSRGCSWDSPPTAPFIQQTSKRRTAGAGHCSPPRFGGAVGVIAHPPRAPEGLHR
jgi:hypothetical protein